MMEMQAVIGRIQLRHMAFWHEERLSKAHAIWRSARALAGLRVPEVPADIEHAAYKCYVFVEPRALKADWSRDRILNEINARSVPCYSGSCSEVYLEKAFDNTGWRPEERLPVARELGETSLMFLVHPGVTTDEIQRTCDALTGVMALAAA
jgi:dTDP-4-amino-4,6-dideoxygalactose transaminase